MLRNHGQDGKHRFLHHRIGWNSRFDEVQAAFQLHRLPGLAARLERRARIAAHYTERFAELSGHGVVAPPPGREGRCHYVYTLRRWPGTESVPATSSASNCPTAGGRWPPTWPWPRSARWRCPGRSAAAARTSGPCSAAPGPAR